MLQIFHWQSIYATLDRISFLKKSFTLKFLFIAFIGIHIPLIGLVVFLNGGNADEFSYVQIILITLILTLIATSVTLFVVNNLLKPLTLSKNALIDFYRNRTLPNLPVIHQDEVGELMRLVNKTLKSLDVLSKEKQQLTALVSHNLRTPLNQIVSLCELIKTDDESKIVYTDSISKIAENQLTGLSHLLNQLVNNNNSDFEKEEPFNLIKLIEEEVEKQKLQTSIKDINVIIKKEGEDFFLMTSKKSNVALVFHNILSNAIKFSYRDSEITINIYKKEGKVAIEVEDQGIGFDHDYKERLFNNINEGRLGTLNEPSLGVGLHLSKKTINEVGGDLIAESSGNQKGATFTLII